MINYQDLIIEPLNNIHNRPGFSCGNQSLDKYLQQQAKQDVKRKVSRVFVATPPELSSHIVGYYTLSALSINLSQLPETLARKLPKHPIPTALIGRLAVLQQAQGQNVGKMLLTNAIKRTLCVSSEITIYTMVVDAIDKQAERFYRQYGFSPLKSGHRRLYLPLNSFCSDCHQDYYGV